MTCIHRVQGSTGRDLGRMRGWGGSARPVLGSVSHAVTHGCSTPVMVVR